MVAGQMGTGQASAGQMGTGQTGASQENASRTSFERSGSGPVTDGGIELPFVDHRGWRSAWYHRAEFLPDTIGG